jgi:hypothetical protein
MAGGVLAAVLGPNLAIHSRGWYTETPFLGAFIGLFGLYALALLLLRAVRLAAPSAAVSDAPQRPLGFGLSEFKNPKSVLRLLKWRLIRMQILRMTGAASKISSSIPGAANSLGTDNRCP